jgi:site-specific recombinase XerD
MNRCDCPSELDESRLQPVLANCAPRDALLLTIGFGTGLRISEMLGLRVGDVWQNGAPVRVLRVTRKRLKGGRGKSARAVKSRAIPLNAHVRAAVVEYFKNNPDMDKDAPLFPSREGGAITRRQATRIIRRIFLAAGCDPSRVWASHSLRKRFVRRVYDATKDINIARAAVGHRWIATTQLYLGLDEEEAQAAILALDQEEPAAGAPQTAAGSQLSLG